MVMATLKEQLMAILVCNQCGAPVEFDKSDKVYRHKEPLDRFCKKNGYPVTPKVKS
jgi:transcription initiation factor IIE alpha subunit